MYFIVSRNTSKIRVNETNIGSNDGTMTTIRYKRLTQTFYRFLLLFLILIFQLLLNVLELKVVFCIVIDVLLYSMCIVHSLIAGLVLSSTRQSPQLDSGGGFRKV